MSSTLSIRVKREKLMQDSLALFKQVNHPTSLLGMAGLIGLTGWADMVGLIWLGLIWLIWLGLIWLIWLA